MRLRHDYLPFIAIFIICIVIISTITVIRSDGEQANVIINQVDSTRIDWYMEKTGAGNRPNFPDYVNEFVDNYNIIPIGKEDESLYLTFNCGYEYENYTSEFLDILKEEDIEVAFFITGEYLIKNPQIVNRMIDEGHIVGNHGNTHADLSKLDADSIRKEITDFEDSFKKVTGKEISEKYFRPASGTYTELSLAIAYELGYTTVFWSMAYEDWNVDKQPGREVALNKITENCHDGCIFMLHTVSESNRDALRQCIKQFKSKGYEFMSIEQLVTS